MLKGILKKNFEKINWNFPEIIYYNIYFDMYIFNKINFEYILLVFNIKKNYKYKYFCNEKISTNNYKIKILFF